MLQNRKVTPNLDQQSTKALNLIVLQRGDPFVEEILMTATHVTLYEFSIDLNQWVLPSAPPNPSPPFLDRDFFVSNTQPRFQFIVMNRRNAGIRLKKREKKKMEKRGRYLLFLGSPLNLSPAGTGGLPSPRAGRRGEKGEGNEEKGERGDASSPRAGRRRDLVSPRKNEVTPHLPGRERGRLVSSRGNEATPRLPAQGEGRTRRRLIIWWKIFWEILNMKSRILNAYSKVPPKPKVPSAKR
ncbi:hypothetical protein GW17_00023027 [Ensete ventricosum]|nr:hypothetical protein GW17_00023027 [Ensete ventricosum]